MKKCNRCGLEKELEEFYKGKRYKDGHYTTCKSCINERGKQRLHDSQAHEKHKMVVKLWYENHKDEVQTRGKAYRSNHREQYREYNRQWQRRNPDKCRDKRHARRALGEFPKDFKLMSHCWVCLSTENLQVDHILPVSRGGTNDISNLTTLCGSCNSSKNNLTYSEWFEKRAQRASQPC